MLYLITCSYLQAHLIVILRLSLLIPFLFIFLFFFFYSLEHCKSFETEEKSKVKCYINHLTLYNILRQEKKNGYITSRFVSNHEPVKSQSSSEPADILNTSIILNYFLSRWAFSTFTPLYRAFAAKHLSLSLACSGN